MSLKGHKHKRSTEETLINLSKMRKSLEVSKSLKEELEDIEETKGQRKGKGTP